eukprot:m.1631780 g.1631780  ORF g.1631780 m.1631780 type:complete len:258 (+) comp25403_c0_seq38:2629-3402(+)
MHWAYTVAAYPVSSMQSWSATRRCGSGVEDIDHGSVQTGHAVVPCGCARHGAGLKTAHEPAETAVGRYARMVTNTYQQLSSGTPPCLCRLLRVGQVAEGWRPQHQTDLRYHEIESQTSSQDCSKSTKTPTCTSLWMQEVDSFFGLWAALITAARCGIQSHRLVVQLLLAHNANLLLGRSGCRCWTRWRRRDMVLLMSAPWYPRSRSAPGPNITVARRVERLTNPPTTGQSLVGPWLGSPRCRSMTFPFRERATRQHC